MHLRRWVDPAAACKGTTQSQVSLIDQPLTISQPRPDEIRIKPRMRPNREQNKDKEERTNRATTTPPLTPCSDLQILLTATLSCRRRQTNRSPLHRLFQRPGVGNPVCSRKLHSHRRSKAVAPCSLHQYNSMKKETSTYSNALGDAREEGRMRGTESRSCEKGGMDGFPKGGGGETTNWSCVTDAPVKNLRIAVERRFWPYVRLLPLTLGGPVMAAVIVAKTFHV